MAPEAINARSRHLVDAALLPLLDAFSLGELCDSRLVEIRAQVAGMMPNLADPPGGLRPAEQWLPGEAGAPDVRVLIYDPGNATSPRPAILHIHGGGYIIGAPELNHATNQAWATSLGAVIVSVDYRLAPEHPFPAALDDCHAALAWLHRSAGALHVDPARIAVMGDSAGGGLAATLALRARDGGEFPLAFQMLAEPMLDDRTGRDGQVHPFAGEFMWTAADNCYGWGSYLRGHDHAAPPRYAAAARAADLSGLPPTFIAVGALDLFLNEDLDYARRLIAAGVPTELHVYPGGVHAFDLMPGTRIGASYARDKLDAMRRAFGLAA